MVENLEMLTSEIRLYHKSRHTNFWFAAYQMDWILLLSEAEAEKGGEKGRYVRNIGRGRQCNKSGEGSRLEPEMLFVVLPVVLFPSI